MCGGDCTEKGSVVFSNKLSLHYQHSKKAAVMVLPKVFLLLAFSLLAVAQSDSPWAWSCIAGTPHDKCAKERKVEGSLTQTSLEACKLTCGTYGSLFPYPKQVTLGKSTSLFTPHSVTTGVINCLPNVCPLIDEAFDIFMQSIIRYHPDSIEGSDASVLYGLANQAHVLSVDISIDSPDEQLLLSTDESYTLVITTVGAATKVSITAPNFFGARHGLETLSQLIDFDDITNSLQIVSEVDISDQPSYKYRGAVIDTSRNYMPVEQLKKIIAGLAYNKLNTFHWHITDSQSFPFHMYSLPNMTRYGAYSHREIYKPEDIAKIVQYAKVRGVRVLPEFDAPAHAGAGWQWGQEAGLGDLVVCVDKQPWAEFCAGPPCGQLNIANPNIYTVISKIYKEMISAFGPIDLFHYGGDEIFMNCWNSTDEIVEWMKTKSPNLSAESYYEEWSIFQEKVYQLFTEANSGISTPGILWTSALTKPANVDKYLNKDKYIIQIWTTESDPVIADLLHKGYKIIMSNYDKLYLDCGFSSWVADGNNWCSPYKGWQDIYGNDITTITRNSVGGKNIAGQVLGGEAGVWSEQIDSHTMDARLWPRTSALAERLWSDPTTNYRHAESRLLEQRRRMALRGLRPSRLAPEWCRQNTGECAINAA